MTRPLSATVTALAVYPVKSMRGIALEQARLAPEGLEHDRRFMVVHADGRFVTQRELPALALVTTRFENSGVTLSAAGTGSLHVPFGRTDGARVQVRIWGQQCAAIDQGEDVAAWLVRALNADEPLRLVGMAPGFVRPQGKPEELGPDTHALFADAAPYLVTNDASLAALGRELRAAGHDAVPMDRFRPNIVLRGPEAFAEHAVRRAAGPGYALRFAHPCRRCVVTTIDQATARRDPDREPFRTLQRLNPESGSNGAPVFGQNAALDDGAGATIRLGDTLYLEGASR
jgi:uncharacterized protein YcbX